ncbi:GNAT family N-acetyltransferase [Sulfuriflexus mobilis]|uniref:GNAT family N-acetyltransferase n=1 Tax=Sulfuriflexus mobilis TaxID=1811807 RepID=UPI0018D54EA9|nr:GNAT family N-acetyltransferase [Sulfuriflexus mobilis]
MTSTGSGVANGVHAYRDIRTSMYIIEPIHKQHRRKAFDCGKPGLNEYLSRFARQNDKKNIAKTFVAVDDDGLVKGYYSLCTSQVEFEELPDSFSGSLPEYPIPAALVARLAVDRGALGQGLGARLLIDALQRVLTASAEMAVKVVIVDALDDEARRFYEHYGFMALPGQEYKLFLPIETIQAVFS